MPRTWDIDIAYADELEELWADDLWDLASELEGQAETPTKWWILKPGMADRGNGIRLFNSKEMLHSIFDEFEEQDSYEASGASSEEEGEDLNGSDPSDTAVMMSQVRHFVIQVRTLSVYSVR